MRALSQSLAREFGPKGVHVAHAIIDAVIDIPRTQAYQVNDGKPDGKTDPNAVCISPSKSCVSRDVDRLTWEQIADSYWYLSYPA